MKGEKLLNIAVKATAIEWEAIILTCLSFMIEFNLSGTVISNVFTVLCYFFAVVFPVAGIVGVLSALLSVPFVVYKALKNKNLLKAVQNFICAFVVGMIAFLPLLILGIGINASMHGL